MARGVCVLLSCSRYQYLVATYPDCEVQWLNKDEESKASYDICVTDKVSWFGQK